MNDLRYKLSDDDRIIGKFIITFEWPFESGDDAADTFWGNKAYEYYSLNPRKNSIELEVKLIASQVEDDAGKDE